ncbi:MAG: OmpH family outer membrane protein [Candidatus Margulisiibacteriota bacterium]
MKKFVRSTVSFLVVFCLVAMTASAFAAPVSSIGTIDVQKVFKGYKETTKAQEQLSKEEASFKKEFEESQKKIEDAKTAGKSEKDLAAMTKKLEESLAPKREKLIKMNEALTSSLQNDIIATVKDVAKNLGIEVVFDKQVVITGGIDVSDMVINKLNEKK